MKEINENIKAYLSSFDIELVRLGATLIESTVPRKYWIEILAEYSRKETNPMSDLDSQLVWGTSFYPQQKWNWEISHEGIKIKEIDKNGLWSQLNSGYRHTYSIKTGKGGINLLQKSMKEYLKSNKQPKNETTKKPDKKQWRKQVR